MNKPNLKFRLALLLSLPVVAFFLAHFLNHGDELYATGFIQYDNVSYAANAKQYLDGGSRGIFYRNPMGSGNEGPAIYFQPQNFLLVALMGIGFPPGISLCLFVWFFSVICFRLVIAIYDHLCPNSSYRSLHILFFAWGGGLLVAAGAIAQQFSGITDLDFFDRVFLLDPGWGWWGLSLGRSLFFSMEAYYHALFLGTVVCLLKKKWLVSLLTALLLSISHPFTGVELLCIVCGWLATELIFVRNKSVPAWLFPCMLLLLAGHIAYYMFYLNRFPEHHSVSEQYALNWRYRFFNFIPAYTIVAGLAVWAILAKGWRHYFAQAQNRLFACWALIAFALANHELFMKPMQPLHFTRGYEWTGLFLMGLPALSNWYAWLKKKKVYKWALPVFSIVFLMDNFLWVANYCRFTTKTVSATHISREVYEVLEWVNKNSDVNTVVISSEDLVPYLATVYSPAYAWLSHPFTTPYAAERKQEISRFMKEGTMPAAWGGGRRLIFIFLKSKPEEMERAHHLPFEGVQAFDSGNYLVFTNTPAGKP